MQLLKYFLTYIIPFILFLTPSATNAQIGWTKAYENGVVVTAEQNASDVGKEILMQGGNAVDAAVAVQFALAVTLPRAGNIGGGGFMVLNLADGSSRALDFREKAPRKAHKDMYIRDGKYIPELSRESILASGVPGVVDGMVKVLERYGRFPLEKVLAPAIELAREGFRLSWIQAEALNEHAKEFNKYEGSAKYFIKPDGEPYKEGDLFKQTDLANTLERIANFGREGFYSGQTADMIVREMRKHNGLITHRDLKQYNSIWRDPIQISFRGYNLHIMPPPSSGSIAVAQILQMLNSHNLEETGFNSSDYIHLVTEAMRRAFADRAHFLGDPDFVDIPTDRLISGSYNNDRMASFNPQEATDSREISHGDIPSFSESSQTTHFSIVDREGNAVAITTTLNGSFGNHISVSGAGFLLNNEMDDFTSKPGKPNMFGLIQGEANAIEPGKRMLSSMTPTIVTKNGSVKMVLGAAGGPRIITATLQNFLNVAVFGMNSQQAVSAPRFHHQWLPDKLYYEPFGISKDTRLELDRRGHLMAEKETIGRSHIIIIDENGQLHGAADPRGDGKVSGF